MVFTIRLNRSKVNLHERELIEMNENKAMQISLAAARVNAELKQEEAAPRLGVTAKTLSNYERGISVTPSNVLSKASKLYGIPMDLIRLPVLKDNEYEEEEIFLNGTSVLPNYQENSKSTA